MDKKIINHIIIQSHCISWNEVSCLCYKTMDFHVAHKYYKYGSLSESLFRVNMIYNSSHNILLWSIKLFQ